MNYSLFIIPFLSAFIGWVIYTIAIRFLFYPVKPTRFPGITIQGLFPKRKKQLSIQLGQLAANELASINLEEKIGDPANFKKLAPMIEEHVDDFLRNKLKEQMPMISMFIGEKTIQSMKEVFMKELETLFPQVMKQYAGNIKNELNVEQFVAQKIETISSKKLENLLSRQLRWGGVIGIITGFVIGILQLIFTWIVK